MFKKLKSRKNRTYLKTGSDEYFQSSDGAKLPPAVSSTRGSVGRRFRCFSSYKNMESRDSTLDIRTNIQIHGILFKRPFGHPSSKWSKRFFIIKDGFLLYYPENEKKIFERRKSFNIHPKGVIPLDGCSVEPAEDQNQKYAIHIKHENFHTQGTIALSTENECQRETWIKCLRESGRVTWKNAQIGEAIIRELESQGLQLNQEKQSYADKLQMESIALRDEIEKCEELENIAAELEIEKNKLEVFAQDLQTQLDRIKLEQEEMINTMCKIEEENSVLTSTTYQLQGKIENFAEERNETLGSLRLKEEEAMRLSSENHNLFQAIEDLKTKLSLIEEKTKQALEEKRKIDQRLRENEERALDLKEEKDYCKLQEEELMASLTDLQTQKQMTEAELKEEVIARMSAEKRLKAAENSILHLEKSLEHHSGVSDILRGDIMPDVKALKHFFEKVAEEVRIDANKPFILKNSLLSRKAMSLKSKAGKFRHYERKKAKSTGILMDECGKFGGMPRCQSQGSNLHHLNGIKETEALITSNGS